MHTLRSSVRALVDDVANRPEPAKSVQVPVARALLVVGLLAGTMAGVACSGSDKSAAAPSSSAKQKVTSGCDAADTSPVALATRAFIKGSDPTPQFFLSAAGTDSGMPEDGLKVLQDKGPTYFYAGTDAARKKVRDKLDANGPYTSLLVVFRGLSTDASGNKTVKLGGHYVFVNGKPDPKAAPERTFQIVCESPNWKLVGEPAGKPQ